MSFWIGEKKEEDIFKRINNENVMGQNEIFQYIY